jgi:hypothetical protein
MLNPLRGFDAVVRAFQYLDIHLALVLVLAAVLTALSWAKLTAKPDGGLRPWLSTKFSSTLAFASLGWSLAYLLSLGVDKNSGGLNPLLTTIATPLIPIITGGITFVESTGTAGAAKPSSGMIAFLAAFIISYQTFVYQISHLW